MYHRSRVQLSVQPSVATKLLDLMVTLATFHVRACVRVGATTSSTRSLDLVVFGVAAIGVVKCYYDAYRCVRTPATLPVQALDEMANTMCACGSCQDRA